MNYWFKRSSADLKSDMLRNGHNGSWGKGRSRQ